MSPDSAETRLGKLERAVAKVEQRLEDLMTIVMASVRQDLQDCADAVKTSRAELGGEIKTLRAEVEQERRDLAEKERAQRRERVLDRRWMVGTGLASAGVIIAAMALLVGS